MSPRINGATGFTGIIGDPIQHTLSPVFQNAAFAHVGLNWVYLPFKVTPDRLGAALAGLAACGCRGLNVTLPHKRAVVALIDEVDDSARLVQAVNTIEFQAGRLVGHNTDGIGFIRSLKAEGAFDPAGRSALVIGAGGTAQTIAVSLAAAGAAEIKILNRTLEKAEKIVGLVRSHFPGCSISVGEISEPAEVENRHLIVNATSVGMATNPGLPFRLDRLHSDQIVYDVIYWPSETEFLRLAKAKGAKTVNGARMLLYQGAAAFSVWTKLEAPIERMATALELEVRDRETEGLSATDKPSAGKNTARGETDNPGTAGGGQGG